MKVVHINKTDTGGGAAVAAHRIHEALLGQGVDSKMVVESRRRKDASVVAVSGGLLGRAVGFYHFVGERLAILPNERQPSMRYNFSIGNLGRDISRVPEVAEADVLHLHWVNQGFLSLQSLERLAALGKPIVWTLHDMWAFTGGCHYAGTCLEFNEKCGFCPLMKKPGKDDLSSRIFKAKRALYSKMNLTVVSCSQWLNSFASSSALMKGVRCTSISNPIDTEVFRVLDKQQCRRDLGLPLDKKLILFGAAKVDDVRKGFRFLDEALTIIGDSFPVIASNMDLVVFGQVKHGGVSVTKVFNTHVFNFISDTETLVKLYNAVDVFVLPSLQDNLPNTVVESMACGTPVVGFRIGGVPEMVVHGKTGFLAEVKNSLSLANGICSTLFLDPVHGREVVREHAVGLYSQDTVAKKYISVYEKALARQS